MGEGGTFPVGFCGIGDMWKVGGKFSFLVKWKCWDRGKKVRGRGERFRLDFTGKIFFRRCWAELLFLFGFLEER